MSFNPHVRDKRPRNPNRARGNNPNVYVIAYSGDGLKSCSICGLCQDDFDPLGLRLMKFRLDHIEGDYHKNEKKDLRWICPLCDQDLSTTSRNKTCLVDPIPSTVEVRDLLIHGISFGYSYARLAELLTEYFGTRHSAGQVKWFSVQFGILHMYQNR